MRNSHDRKLPALEARNRPVCRDERLLRRIVGQIWIAQHAPGVPEDRLLMAVNQFRERPSIPIPRPGRELIVVRVHRPRHTRAWDYLDDAVFDEEYGQDMDKTEVSDVGERVSRVIAGGDERNRTADKGFADPCLTTWLRRPAVRRPVLRPDPEQASSIPEPACALPSRPPSPVAMRGLTGRIPFPTTCSLW